MGGNKKKKQSNNKSKNKKKKKQQAQQLQNGGPIVLSEGLYAKETSLPAVLSSLGELPPSEKQILEYKMMFGETSCLADIRNEIAFQNLFKNEG